MFLCLLWQSYQILPAFSLILTNPTSYLLSTYADLLVEIITAAILYGSPFEAGRRSSSLPFQPSSIVPIGILIDAPLSETPYENSSIDWVSCFQSISCDYQRRKHRCVS